MTLLTTAFLSSCFISFLIIRFNYLHIHITSDNDFAGPQKFHTAIVPRVGGLSILSGAFLAVLLANTTGEAEKISLHLLLCAVPAFAIGLAEDVTKKISIFNRLFFVALSGFLAVNILNFRVTNLDMPGLDFLLSITPVGYLFTIFAITGLTNSYNIIDGFNGLASMVGIITLIGLSYVSFALGDEAIFQFSIILIGAIAGFFIWNYPNGLIFLGDGGAYLVGFWVACLTILITFRHPEISPWFALFVNGYPILETTFSIYRRRIHKGKSPSKPDGIHFHTLIYRRISISSNKGGKLISANSKTAPYLWILNLACVIPAIYLRESSVLSFLGMVVLTFLYLTIYRSIVNFKTPKWLHL